MCTYSGLQTFCVCSLVFLLPCYLSVSTTRSLGLPNSTCLIHPLWPLARPSVTSLTLWLFEVLFEAVQV
jgi:hypothetical protein